MKQTAVILMLITLLFSCKKEEAVECHTVHYKLRGSGWCELTYPLPNVTNGELNTTTWTGAFTDTIITFTAQTGSLVGCLASTEEGVVIVSITVDEEMVLYDTNEYPFSEWTGGQHIIE